MKLHVKQAGSAHELAVATQKEFLQLWNSGVIAADDLVLRGDRWVPAGELTWIRGMAESRRTDNRRLFWITLGLIRARASQMLDGSRIISHPTPAALNSPDRNLPELMRDAG